MKKLTAISLIIFWAVIVTLLTSGLVLHQNAGQEASSTAISGSQGSTRPAMTLSMQEIAKHNNATSCWLLIDGKVYDVTSYIYQHPGNADTIIPTCGTDATKAYDTKGRTSRPSPHSQNAHELLKQFYIGDFGQTSVTTPSATTPQTTPTTQTPPTTQNTPTTNSTVTLSMQEIAKHNSTSNCWLIINGNVYGITSYLNQHPGGISAIRPYCGKDGTAAFEGLPHSTNAHQLLANFLIGAVGQTTTTQAIQQQATTQTTTPTGSTGGQEFEND